MLKRMAHTDPLTGLANRRAFFEQGARLVAQGQRIGRPTCMIVFDLDRFKQVNDTYGHPFGDAVLEAFALAAQAGLRAGDLAGRIGGEEFAAILPGADQEEARSAADRVVEIFGETVGVTDEDRERFTTSAGLAVSPASTGTVESLFADADRALYAAKRQGGNQLMIAGPAIAA
jgi:diguanylate cyclase (GGDEF)-like protein